MHTWRSVEERASHHRKAEEKGGGKEEVLSSEAVAREPLHWMFSKLISRLRDGSRRRGSSGHNLHAMTLIVSNVHFSIDGCEGKAKLLVMIDNVL